MPRHVYTHAPTHVARHRPEACGGQAPDQLNEELAAEVEVGLQADAVAAPPRGALPRTGGRRPGSHAPHDVRTVFPHGRPSSSG